MIQQPKASQLPAHQASGSGPQGQEKLARALIVASGERKGKRSGHLFPPKDKRKPLNFPLKGKRQLL